MKTSVNSILRFVFFVGIVLLAGFPAGLAQTNTQPAAAPPKTQRSSPKGAPKKAGGPTARGMQRQDITPSDKQTFDKEFKSAVIVAPSYRDSGLATLRYTFADAVELKAELERQGYTVHTIPSTEATADAIRQALVNQKTYIEGSSQSTLLFAFMGHGFQDSHQKNYLMTYGADLNNMDKEALAVDEVEELINATGARRKVIFVDACRNSAGTRAATEPRTMADFHAAEGLAVLLATRPGAYSYEDPELSHGVFTYYLLSGLRGKAAGKDGYVTFHDLGDYVEREVTKYAMQKNLGQKPLATMKDVGGDFLLATAAPPKPDDIKLSPVASQITSDALLMHGTDNKSYFVLLDEHALTLVDSASSQPTLLNEHAEELKDKKQMSKGTYRWFAGDRPDNTTVQIVAELKGNELVRLWGRLGKPCPTPQPCGTSYPQLPGELPDQKDEVKKRADQTTAATKIWKTFKPDKKADKVVMASDVVKNSDLLADTRNKYSWTVFDLVNDAKLAKAEKPNSAP